MFWAKLWLFLITLAAGLAVLAALLIPEPLGRDLERETGARLERAQHAASLLLKVNARKWMDTAAQVAGDAVLVESLDQATRDQAAKGGDLNLVHKTVQERLRYFNDKMKVDLVIATDAKGRVIARAGRDEAVFRDGIEGLPLVSDALRGLRGDDTWSLDGKLYRVAASPVIARNEHYAGSLIVGQEVGGELAQSMKQVLDVEVAFLLRGRVLASSAQLPVLSRLPVMLDQQTEALARTGHSPPLMLDGGDKSYLVVLAPFIGEAAEHKAAYALVLPRPFAGGVPALVSQLLASDPKSLPLIPLVKVGGAALLAFIFGIFLIRMGADRPLKRLVRDAQALARGETQRLDDDRHPGKLGTVARAINTTLDRIGSVSRHTVAAKSQDAHRTPPPRSQPGAFKEAPRPTERMERDSSPVALSHSPLDPLPDEATPIYDPAHEVASRTIPPLAFDPEMTPLPKPLALADTEAQLTRRQEDDGPDLVDAPDLQLPPLQSGRPPMMPRDQISRPMAKQFDEDLPTRNAPPSAQLLGMAAAPQPAPLSAADEADEAELAPVFHEFIETKQRLGESIDGVTYDKFLVKLKANRAQLISRYACKTVKFQVYVKDGKAALKATPVT